MSLFAIADLHLSFGEEKPMDVFKGWENYSQKIEDNWRRIVGGQDTTVIAGDVSWAMSLDSLYADFDFINRLPGKKIILKGNHDYWWETMSKMTRFLDENGFDSIKILHNNAFRVEGLPKIAVCGSRGWFYDAGGDKKILLREAGRIDASIAAAEKDGLLPIVFLHYPPVCHGYRSDEIMDVLKRHDIKRCYFGHLHGRAAANAFEGETEGIYMRLISCDHTGFSPVIIEK